VKKWNIFEECNFAQTAKELNWL